MTSEPSPTTERLPEGTRLIHIGPPKTGTTYLQGAFHANRDAVTAQGVHYAGPTRQPTSAVQALLGTPNPGTGEVPPMRRWRGLVNEVRRAGDRRVVISSEFLADADPGAIRTALDDLGRDRAHVVVTLRPLARIIPSQWQQFIQSGGRKPFDDWLHAIFNDPDRVSPTFWRRHRHDQLIARWAAEVGNADLTVVALDDRDHEMVTRVFEDLVGLRRGTLIADEDRSNRSMTLAEIEVVRAFNEQFFAAGLSRQLHTQVMRFGATAYMKSMSPDPDEPRVALPDWALERAGQVSREMIDAIVRSGVRIIGDPQMLTIAPDARPTDTPARDLHVSPETAATAAMGIVVATGLARGHGAAVSGRAAHGPAEPLPLARIPTYQLAGVLWHRVQAIVARWTHRLVRRSRA
jgi:hypothetical protein